MRLPIQKWKDDGEVRIHRFRRKVIKSESAQFVTLLPGGDGFGHLDIDLTYHTESRYVDVLCRYHDWEGYVIR
jgi:hypothetical protein